MILWDFLFKIDKSLKMTDLPFLNIYYFLNSQILFPSIVTYCFLWNKLSSCLFNLDQIYLPYCHQLYSIFTLFWSTVLNIYSILINRTQYLLYFDKPVSIFTLFSSTLLNIYSILINHTQYLLYFHLPFSIFTPFSSTILNIYSIFINFTQYLLHFH